MSEDEDRVYNAPAKSKAKKSKNPWENISRGVKVCVLCGANSAL